MTLPEEAPHGELKKMAMIRIHAGSDMLPAIVSVSIFLFFSLTLSAYSGYSYGSGLLLLVSAFFLAQRPALGLSSEDKAIAYLLLGVFLFSLFIFFLHGNEPRTLDQTSRCLLAVPILLLLLKVPPRLAYLWAGLVAGGISSAGVTWWQLNWLGAQRAAGFVTSAVPFGDISLMMGVLCVAGMFWAKTQGRYEWHWRAALLLSVLACAYSVIASETRGAWLAVLPVLPLFCWAFLTKQNVKRVMAAGLAFIVALSVFFIAVPDNVFSKRYDLAVTEVDNYFYKHEATSSIGARLEVWRAALMNIPKKPLLGWSHKDYNAELKRQVAKKEIDPFALNLVNTHNNYVQVLLFQGIFGLLALLALYFFPFWFFCKRLNAKSITVRALAVSGASLLASFFLFGMTHDILGRNNGVIFFVLTLVVLWACMRKEEAVAAGTG